MLSRLFSVQTNLCISFHYQSGVLLHKGTTLYKVLLSSQIGNAMGKKVWLKQSLPKCQPDQNLTQGSINLTKGQPTKSSNTLGHEMSLSGGYIWLKVSLPKVVPHLAMRCHYQEGTSDQRSACQSSTTLGHEMPLVVVGIGVSLTKGQPDPKIWQKGQPELKPYLWGDIWPKVSLTWRSDKNVNLTQSLTYWGGPSD